jgi:putative hydrolase of the HAD superfamily
MLDDKMEKLTPKAVIFDLGSTIVEYPSEIWEEVSIECVGHARQVLIDDGHSLPPAEEFYKAYAEIRDEYRRSAADTLVEWNVLQVARRLLKRAGVEPNEEMVEKFFDAYYLKVRPHIIAFEDAREVLQRVRDHYGTVGLISNTVFPEEAHLSEMERFGLIEFFAFTIFSSTFGVRKPHRDIFYHAANLAGFAPAECVYIGDRYREDVEGPNEVGMPAILKWHADREYPDPLPEGTRLIHSLTDLSEHFEL